MHVLRIARRSLSLKLFEKTKRFFSVSVIPMSSKISLLPNLQRPLSETREYCHVELPNKLQALIISDPECDFAACALSVDVGSLFDPKEIPGLAHFLEHMLFLGTKKYPDESEYTRYLQQHAGSHNAFTTNLTTCYFFSLAPDALAGGLDRFSQFFVEPLFTPSATDREIDAVDSEHSKNLLSDDFRFYHLTCQFANPNHPLNHFSTGNAITLRNQALEKNINIRDELIKFYNKYYSSNIMKLCLIGKESLEDLQKMLFETGFAQIQNRNVTIPKKEAIGGKEVPWRPDDLKKFIRVVPVRDIKRLRFQWIIPEQTDLWEAKPTLYLSHLLGHEGKGSLLSALKQKGYATELYAGPDYMISLGGATPFFCRIELTELGTQNIENIGRLVHEYIDLLKTKGIQDWVNDELEQLGEIQFKYMSRSSSETHAVHMAETMQIYPPEVLLSVSNRLFKKDPELIKQVLDCFTLDKLIISQADPSFKSVVDTESWETESWYKIRYHEQKIPEGYCKAWSKLSQTNKLTDKDYQFAFPKPNPFIPQNLQLKAPPTPTVKLPEKLSLPASWSHVYHKQDTTFKLPKAVITMRFATPYARIGPKELTIVELFCRTVREQINEYTYDARMAGLDYSLRSTAKSYGSGEPNNGFELHVGGYNDSLMKLFQELCERVCEPTFQIEHFNVAKTIAIRQLQIESNFQQPYQQGVMLTRQLMQIPFVGPAERLKITEEMTFEEIKGAIPKILKNLVAEGIIHGNYTENDAKILCDYIKNKFEKYNDNKGVVKFVQSKTPKLMSLKQTSKTTTSAPRLRLKKTASNPEEENHATIVFINVGVEDYKNSALLNVAHKYIREPFFDSLRTKQQLGYIVTAMKIKFLHNLSLCFLVQSNRLEPNQLLLRIEGFIEQYLSNIEEKLSEEEFIKLRDAAIVGLLEKPKSIEEEASWYYNEVVERRYDYDRHEKEAEFLKTCKRETFIDYVKSHLMDAPWIAAQVFAPKKSTAEINHNAADNIADDIVDKILLKPNNPVEWKDIEEDLPTFIQREAKEYYEFPLPGKIQSI